MVSQKTKGLFSAMVTNSRHVWQLKGYAVFWGLQDSVSCKINICLSYECDFPKCILTAFLTNKR
jgi:hypothetical protein